MARCPFSQGVPKSHVVVMVSTPLRLFQAMRSPSRSLLGPGQPGMSKRDQEAPPVGLRVTHPAGSAQLCVMSSCLPHRQLQLCPARPRQGTDSLHHAWLP